MSEYWDAVCCGVVFGFFVGFVVGGAWVHRVHEGSRRQVKALAERLRGER